MKDQIEKYKNLLLIADKDAFSKSLNNVHHKGLFSLVIGGIENGKLTRVFIAHEKIKPFDIQLHSHRYYLRITPLQGYIKQHEAYLSSSNVNMDRWSYKSILNGGNGLTYKSEEEVSLKEFNLPVGSNIEMDVDQIHTISCSKNSIWVVEEFGFKTDESIVLGISFKTKGFYTEVKQLEINVNRNLVLNAMNKILKHY